MERSPYPQGKKSMKSVVLLAALTLTASADVSAAGAYTLSPRNTNFVAAGTANIVGGTANQNCDVSLSGTINAMGVAMITGVSLSGGAPSCGSDHAVGLPWPMTAVAATKARIGNFSIEIGPQSLQCGPNTVTVTIRKKGAIDLNNIQLNGPCRINGSLTTRPRITIE
jgi:hypothetical protein